MRISAKHSIGESDQGRTGIQSPSANIKDFELGLDTLQKLTMKNTLIIN